MANRPAPHAHPPSPRGPRPRPLRGCAISTRTARQSRHRPPATLRLANPARKPAKLPRQNFPVDALRPVWQNGAAMAESENQFSLTRAASSTSGRVKKQIPISHTPAFGTRSRFKECRFREGEVLYLRLPKAWRKRPHTPLPSRPPANPHPRPASPASFKAATALANRALSSPSPWRGESCFRKSARYPQIPIANIMIMI